MAELADAADSKSADRKVVGVRPPLPAPPFNEFQEKHHPTVAHNTTLVGDCDDAIRLEKER